MGAPEKMSNEATRAKWDKAAKTYDLMGGEGPEKRWEPAKRQFFSRMGDGKILFLAVGTGLDISAFPEGKNITGIDLSPAMLEFAKPRAEAYQGNLSVQTMDVFEMDFPDHSFDQVFTSCTFCSVPNPVAGLECLKRVLKPQGELHMFEHTASRWFPFSLMLNIMTPLSRKFGPEMNRPTPDNVRSAGYEITAINNVYLDIVKTIHATAP
jgi:ubiquinone/menaquinone biosynthesis C-methylase UbiE